MSWAIDGFRRHNVTPVRRLIPAMKTAGSTKLVISGLYDTAIARQRPDLVGLSRNPAEDLFLDPTDDGDLAPLTRKYSLVMLTLGNKRHYPDRGIKKVRLREYR